jgi:hypothetical protein
VHGDVVDRIKLPSEEGVYEDGRVVGRIGVDEREGGSDGASSLGGEKKLLVIGGATWRIR